MTLGFDCDDRELEEFDIVRAIWYPYIDFDVVDDVDPRQYCVVCSDDGTPYLISVLDHWNKKAINRYEGRNEDACVPVKVLPISEAVHYESAYTCDEKIFTYPFNREVIGKTLNKTLKERFK